MVLCMYYNPPTCIQLVLNAAAIAALRKNFFIVTETIIRLLFSTTSFAFILANKQKEHCLLEENIRFSGRWENYIYSICKDV